MEHQAVTFLIVDDDQVSIMAMQRTIKKLRIANPVQVAHDGEEALRILRNEASSCSIQRPYIVILDLNMPRMSGHEFLKILRNDPDLSDTTVFVMSTSDAPQDVKDAYMCHAAGYILKDGSPDNFRNALSMLDAFAEVVVLPNA